MRIDVYLPLLLSLLLSAVSGRVGRRVAPASAARVLTAAGVATAAATTWALILLAATLVDQAPPVVADAHADGRRLPEPVPEAIAMAALAALVVIACRLHRAIRTERTTRRALRRLCEGHPADTELVVAASATPRAFAIPGTPGRILVTSAMLAALQPAERRVLLAHERAHARAAVAAHRSACALNFSDRAVLRRIAALQSAPPPRLRPIAASILALGVLPAFDAAGATGDLLRLLGQALT